MCMRKLAMSTVQVEVKIRVQVRVKQKNFTEWSAMTTVGNEVIAKCKEKKGRRMKGETGAINARKGREVKPRTRRRRQRKRGAGVGVENVNWHRSNCERAPQPKLS
jgi:hypothetical protein